MFSTNVIMTVLITVFINILIAKNLFKEEINFKSRRILIGIFLQLVFIFIIIINCQNLLKTVLLYILISISYRFIFNTDFLKRISVVTTVFICYFFAEIIFTMFLMVVLKVDAADLVANWQSFFLSDLLIGLMALLISKIKIINKIFLEIIKKEDRSKYLKILFIFILVLGIFCIKNGLFLGINEDYINNLILIISFFVIVYYLFKEKEYSTKLSDKYDQLFKYIDKYEKELTEKSLCIHEFKNQIISIKGFISKKDKELNEYINSIVIDFKKTESKILKNMENLPQGGLKGLIYYKLGDLEEKGIKVVLDIDKSTKKSPYSKNNSNLYNEILKIIGVYLDNAIEAAILSEKKEIVLEIYYSDQLFNFILSNSYNGKINLKFLGKKRISTKGNKKGYGLLLVEKILKSRQNITCQTQIINNYFIQHLTVDFKNISKN